MILDNCRIIREVMMLAHHQAIFTDVLGMKCAAAQISPKLINFEQKQRRMNIAQEMLMTINDDPDLLK